MYVVILVDSTEDEYHKSQIQSEGGVIMSPNDNPIVDFSANKASVIISLNATQYRYVSTRATFDNTHPYSHPYSATSSSSISTPITPSKSLVSTSAALDAYFTPSSKINKMK